MSASTGVRGRVARRASVGGLVDAAVGLVVTALLLAGLARPGFPLLRDWVATPDPPLSDAALGLGGSAARAVPQDVAMVWASHTLSAVGLPVWPLTGLLTAVFCVWLAVAAGALVRLVLPESGAGFRLRLPAVVGAVWNPFVVERLLQGHWSLLAGVAAVMTMPVLLAGPSWRARGERHRRVGIAGACAALAAAGLTPTGWVLAVIAATIALACADAPAARKVRAGAALGVTAVVTAGPWLLATALNGLPEPGGGGVDGAGGTGAGPAGQTGVAAFAARAEPGIATIGSVVSLGGIWNSEAVPSSRTTWWAAVALVLVLLVWAVAARGLWRSRHLPAVRATVPTALAVWILVALAATGPGLAVMDALVAAVPGAGLLRDTQKFVALALPATVLAMAMATRALAALVRPAGAALAVAAVAVATVPDAPRATWEQLEPVTYGPGWAQVAAIVDGQPGDLLVLPAGSFRSTPLWSDGRAVLDPAPRLLDTHVLVAGDLVVGGTGGSATGTRVSGEGERARRATEALLRGEDPQVLAGLGVRWVLDERTSAGPRGDAARTLAGPPVAPGEEPVAAGEEPGEWTTTTTFTNPELTLYELAPPAGAGSWGGAESGAASPGARAVVLAAHALWLVTLAGALALAVALTSTRARSAGRR